jgi:hypothetical protein
MPTAAAVLKKKCLFRFMSASLIKLRIASDSRTRKAARFRQSATHPGRNP